MQAADGHRSRGERFRVLHERAGAFVIPNPWDVGSARILEALGFEALATTSAGLALSLGHLDGEGAISRDDVLRNARDIVVSTTLPVSADLESGFGPLPEDCAETIRLAAGAGLSGGSIEDSTTDPANPIRSIAESVERVAAAVEAARALPSPFVLTARSENFLHGVSDLDDTIRRLQAFERAGADVLYAPGLPDIEAIRTLCASVSKPVNVVMGLKGPVYSVAELAEAGVKRVSVGGALARAALGGLLAAAKEMRTGGTFEWTKAAAPYSEVAGLLRPKA